MWCRRGAPIDSSHRLEATGIQGVRHFPSLVNDEVLRRIQRDIDLAEARLLSQR